MLLRQSRTTTKFAFTAFVLTPFVFVACATGTNRTDIGNGEGGEGGDWGGQSSSSSASSSSGMNAGGAGGGASSSSSSAGPGSSSSGSPASSSSSSSGGGGSGSSSFVVLRVGDGSASLTGSATAVFIDYLEADGTPTPGKFSITMPPFTAGSSWAFTLSGTATAEGSLSLSANGQYVLAAGYGADIGTATVSATDASIYPRVVARIDAFGNVDTSTSLGTAFNASSVRGATSTDGFDLWISGNGAAPVGGVHYATLGASTTTQLVTAPNNARFVHVFDNQVYASSGAGTYVNVFTVGTGLPISAGQTATSLPGMPTVAGPSPYSFALLDLLGNVPGLDTMYVADDRSIANGGGIQRWVYDGFSWTLETTFGDGTSGVRGLAATVEGAGVRIIATTSETPTNRILSIYDEPGFSPSIVPIAISPTNTLYRGVAFAPQ